MSRSSGADRAAEREGEGEEHLADAMMRAQEHPNGTVEFRAIPRRLRPRGRDMIYPRRWLKDLMCHIGLGDRLIEYCNRCGRRQPLVWWTDDRIWSAVAGPQSGAYCPECFDVLTLQHLGVLLQWTPAFHSAYADEWRRFIAGDTQPLGKTVVATVEGHRE